MKRANNPGDGEYPIWECVCDCGNTVYIRSSNLHNKNTNSCGCLKREILKTQKYSYKHGAKSASADTSTARLYRIWTGLRNRCTNVNNKDYKNYGARGISVDESWDDFCVFMEWALENGYTDDKSIDRIDVNAGYTPSNCRWADNKIQANNRRTNKYITCNGVTKTIAQWSDEVNTNRAALYERVKRGINNDCVLLDRLPKNYNGARMVTYNGETHSVSEWSKITGIKYHTLIDRLNKWSPEDALSRPVGG